MYALNYCIITLLRVMFSRTFSISGFSFIICGMMIILTAIEVLHYLELWDKSFWLIMKIVDVAFICDTFICCVIVRDLRSARIMVYIVA